MGLGKPDVKGEHTSLRTEPEQDQDTRRKDLRLRQAVCRSALPPKSRREFRKGQRSRRVFQQYQSHKEEKTADHRHKQIRISRADRRLSLLVDDPRKGRERQNLEENESGHQVRREHDAFNSSQCEQDKELVSAQILFLVGKIFRGEQCRPKPHDRRDHSVDRPETGDTQGKAASRKDSGEHQRLPDRVLLRGIKCVGARGARQHKRQSQNCSRQEKSRILSGFLIPSPYCSSCCGSYKRAKDYYRNQHPVPPVLVYQPIAAPLRSLSELPGSGQGRDRSEYCMPRTHKWGSA